MPNPPILHPLPPPPPTSHNHPRPQPPHPHPHRPHHLPSSPHLPNPPPQTTRHLLHPSQLKQNIDPHKIRSHPSPSHTPHPPTTTPQIATPHYPHTTPRTFRPSGSRSCYPSQVPTPLPVPCTHDPTQPDSHPTPSRTFTPKPDEPTQSRTKELILVVRMIAEGGFSARRERKHRPPTPKSRPHHPPDPHPRLLAHNVRYVPVPVCLAPKVRVPNYVVEGNEQGKSSLFAAPSSGSFWWHASLDGGETRDQPCAALEGWLVVPLEGDCMGWRSASW